MSIMTSPRSMTLLNAPILNTQTSTTNSTSNTHINNDYTIYNYKLKRRMETFAEAEQRLKSQHIELGILGAGELTGMCEILFDMSSYMQSTRCLEPCDCFYILRSSFERLILKRNTKCAQRVRELLLAKLSLKNERLNQLQANVDLFRSLQYKLELTTRPTVVNNKKVNDS